MAISWFFLLKWFENDHVNQDVNQFTQMTPSISVVCYKSKTLSNGENPLMLQISKDGKRKYQSLGISINHSFKYASGTTSTETSGTASSETKSNWSTYSGTTSTEMSGTAWTEMGGTTSTVLSRNFLQLNWCQKFIPAWKPSITLSPNTTSKK